MTFRSILAFLSVFLTTGACLAQEPAYQTPVTGGYGPSGSVPLSAPPPSVPYTAHPFVAPQQARPPVLPAMPLPPGTIYTPQPAAVESSNPWTLVNTARQMIEENKAQAALPLLETFIEKKPLEPEGYFWQGVALDNLQQTEAALQAYSRGIAQVLRAGMDSAELRLNAGNELFKLRRLDEAIAQYKRAEQINPALPLVHLNLGRSLIEKNDPAQALKYFQRCEELRFNPVQLAYYRAKALKLAGRPVEAKAQAVIAVSKVDPASAAGQKLRQEFNDVLNAPAIEGGEVSVTPGLRSTSR